MKIALIAPSGAGKTVYLTGLYGVMTQFLNDAASYGVNFSVTDVVKKSHLQERYTKLLKSRDFGAPSKDINVYPVALTSRNPAEDAPRRISLEIVDFPGEALYKATEESKAEIEKIKRTLSECDGFIVLLDGKALIEGTQQEDEAILRDEFKAHDIREILYEALERRRKRLDTEKTDPNAYSFSSGPTPIVFALTKGDLVDDWLKQKQADNGAALKKTVRALFTQSANGFYAEDEGAIANLIRSQFSQIIDAPDVVSLRTSVCVYNEKKQKFSPRALDYLFQFVFFTGLLNATAEYERRLDVWRRDFNDMDKKFAAEKSNYERAESDKDRWANQSVWADIKDWWGGRSVDHHSRVASSRESLQKAANGRDTSQLSVKQVEDNIRTARLFMERILTDKLVYLLTHGSSRDSFYQRGLPIEELSKAPWWQRKCASGQQISESYSAQNLHTSEL